MSYIDKKEIECTCGNVFITEAILSVNISDEPEMRDIVADGRFNIVQCPKCKNMLYVEVPFFYIDPKQNMVIYVLPKYCEQEKEKYIQEANTNFELALHTVEDIENDERKKYFLETFFGIEKLVDFIHREDIENEEIDLVSGLAEEFGFKMLELPSDISRRKNIIKKLPIKKYNYNELLNNDDVIINDIIECLNLITQRIPGLKIYKELLNDLNSKDSSFQKIKKDVLSLVKNRNK